VTFWGGAGEDERQGLLGVTGCKGMRERLNWRWKNSPSFEGLPPESDLSGGQGSSCEA